MLKWHNRFLASAKCKVFFVVFPFMWSLKTTEANVANETWVSCSCTGSSRGVLQMLDSEADFQARAKDVGLSQTEVDNLKRIGYATFAKLAFSSSYVPGQADEGPLKMLAAEVTGIDPCPPVRLALVRRLVFESYTLAAADLRMKISRTSDDAPRKLATAERASRYADQVARLPGIEMSGEQEPSHSLIDAIYHMSEEGQLRYVKWDECTKRDQELMGLKSDPVWKADASGIIRETKVKEALTAEYDTDLKLRFALQRRSLAFDQARLVDHQDFERWSQILLEAYTAPAMEGYQKVTIEQLHRADLQLFKVLIRETRNGIKAIGTRQPMASRP